MEEGLLSAFVISGRSGLDCEAADEFALMAMAIVMAAAHKGQPPASLIGYFTVLYYFSYATNTNPFYSIYHVDDYTFGDPLGVVRGTYDDWCVFQRPGMA